MKQTLELGCGLIGIGRKWGAQETKVPSQEDVHNFLNTAFALGIVFFDTAPAYGSSESRLGTWLTQLSETERSQLTVATKFGEHWVDETNETQVDHSKDALVSSLDQSIQRLGKIDVLQLHKATETALHSKDVESAFQYAQSLGIRLFGASISSLEAGKIAIKDGKYSYLQFPLNTENTTLLELIPLCIQSGIIPIINRPVNMGHTLQTEDKKQALTKAFIYLAEKVPQGIILTGTKNPQHLQENVTVFKEAIR